jgi:protein disulfide-isomerase
MRRHWPRIILTLISAMLAAPATAQQVGISWYHDLEAAKTLAKQTNRMVLVHFWTESCAPCLMLDQAVFNQANVASVIEGRFVPVKLNANENPATAQGFGITRVPTDVILTADGEVVGKIISPPTPGGYIAEVTQIAAAYSAKLGQPFASAAASAPSPSQLNAAYANLQLPPETQPAIAQPLSSASVTPIGQPFAQNASPVMPAETPRVPAPAVTTNPNVQPPSIDFAVPPATPRPSPMANPYVAPPIAAAPPIAPPREPAPTQFAVTSAPTATPNFESMQPPAPQPQQSAAPITPISGVPDQKLLPAGAPPLGFEGYCPVSMRTNWKWTPGDPRWGIVHRGRTYWFAGEEEQKQFWSDPDRYSPALSGMDPVMAIDHQQQVPGKREHSIDYDNLFYMFSSEATLAQFTANPERYAVGVRQAMGIPRGRLVR